MTFQNKIPFILINILFFFSIISHEIGFGITIKQEEELSKEFLKIVHKNFKIIDDKFIVDYINEIGYKIANTRSNPFLYHFYIIKENTYNAFAGPGGHIFLTSGLFEAMDNEGELAGILAHEIAHVACRHLSERIEKDIKIQVATLAGVVAGIFLGLRGTPTAANAVTVGSLAAGKSVALAYSRENEIQADQLGLQYITALGYTGTGIISMLKKIKKKQWIDFKQFPAYLTTHPASEERIVYLSNMIDKATPDFVEQNIEQNYKFKMAHSRLLALYSDKDTASRKLDSKLKNNPDDPAANYGYSLVLARVAKNEEALKYIRKALSQKPFDPYILKDFGRILFANGKYKKAVDVIENALEKISDDPEGLFYLGRAKLILSQPNEAVKILEKLIRANPNYKQGYYYIAKAYTSLKKIADAHYNLAIYYKNNEKLKSANFHLKKALASVNDLKKKEKIEKMLSEIEQENSNSR